MKTDMSMNIYIKKKTKPNTSKFVVSDRRILLKKKCFSIGHFAHYSHRVLLLNKVLLLLLPQQKLAKTSNPALPTYQSKPSLSHLESGSAYGLLFPYGVTSL